jgi:Zn-dependent protease with chaperone function
MNFFDYQEAARRQTRWLIFYYGLAVVLIILALYAVTTYLFHYSEAATETGVDWAMLWDPALLGIVALATGGLIFFGSLFKIVSLSSGGEAVAQMLGGRPIAPDTTQFQEKRLLNVVEEMAIASGTPVPRVFVLDNETGINAFAAGFSTKDAVVGVTRGTLETLNREELQGVIAHEFSHILNGDMRLNIRLIGVLNGILVIALTGYWILRILGRSSSTGSSRNKKGNPLAVVLLLGLAMLIIGYIGVFFARLIKSAVSRQREFLADASAVQFTRNPGGLGNALKKIGALVTGSRIQSPEAEAASHLFFANGLSASFLGLLATHPPLEHRISRLDPEFTGVITAPPPAPGTDEPTSSLAPQANPAPLVEEPVSSAMLVTQAGTLPATALTHAAQVVNGLPESLQAAARTPHQAQAILFGLVLDRNPDMRAQQLADLADRTQEDLHRQTLTLLPLLDELPREARPVLASLATATLKQLDPALYPAFRETVMHLVASDSTVSLFEYMILRMMLHNLDPQFKMGSRPRPRYTLMRAVQQEAGTVLSALAWFGTVDPAGAAQSFAAGREKLGLQDLSLLPPEQASLQDMDKALDRLAETTPPVKEKLVAAFAATVSHDGVITPDEVEALRAAADALDCPLPRLPSQEKETQNNTEQRRGPYSLKLAGHA